MYEPLLVGVVVIPIMFAQREQNRQARIKAMEEAKGLKGTDATIEKMRIAMYDKHFEPYRQFVKKQKKENGERMREERDAQNTINSLPLYEQEVIKEVLKKLDEDNHKNNIHKYNNFYK
jgi:hypothetical protein